jgi:hypothetical protein
MKKEPKQYPIEFTRAIESAVKDFHEKGVRAPRGFWRMLFDKTQQKFDYTTVAVIRKKMLNNIELGEQVNEYLKGGKIEPVN